MTPWPSLSGSAIRPPPPGLDGIDTLRVRRGAQVLLSISGTDEDDDLLSYTWNAFHLGPELESGQFTPNANSPQVRWTAPQSIPGRSALYRIVVNISDNQEVTTQDPRRELIVEVLQRAPSLILSPADQQVAARDTLMLAALAEDDDGDRLTYIWALAGEDSTVFETEGRASAQRLALIDAADDTLAWWWTGRNDNLDADGPAAKIEQSRQSTTADTARVVMLGLTPGGYTIDLSVTDALADSAADTVRAAFRVTVAEPAADDTTGP